MLRLIAALLGTSLLTLGPAGYRYSLQNRETVDFSVLAAKLDAVVLHPPGWESTEDIYEFDDHWRSRLDLHHHRSAALSSPTGQRLSILVMLSETGEQLYHTPDVCYAAIGCEIRGDVELIPLNGSSDGDVRAVEVVFNQIGTSSSSTVAYGYWLGSGWLSPAKHNILNVLGRQPFLLKVQVLVDHAALDEEATQQILNEYFDFLSEQFRIIGA